MLFLLMRWENELFVLYDHIKPSQDKPSQRAMSWPKPWCCRCQLARQLRSPGLTWRESANTSWTVCGVKSKTKAESKKNGMSNMFCFDVGSGMLRPGYYPKRGASPCDSSLSARVNTTLPPATSLIDKESAGGQITWCSYCTPWVCVSFINNTVLAWFF